MLLIALNIGVLIAVASQMYMLGKRTYMTRKNDKSAPIHSAGVDANGISIKNLSALELQREADVDNDSIETCDTQQQQQQSLAVAVAAPQR
jgi:hypothetical protein